MSRQPGGWDVDSPVQAEVFVVWLDDDRLRLTGPDGPGPWLLQLGATEHPVEVVDRIVRDVLGPPTLVHSTSWRRDRTGSVCISTNPQDKHRSAGPARSVSDG